jgi:hypothetical protein
LFKKAFYVSAFFFYQSNRDEIKLELINGITISGLVQMNYNSLVIEQSEQAPTQETLNFEYGVLDTSMRSIIQQRASEIKMLMRRNTQDIIDIGQKLIEVKKHLGHGNFQNWLKFEFNWSISTATKFMQVAEQFKGVNFKHLNITASTLYMIAAPSTPKEVRVEVLERASNGENISYTEAKKIVSQYKETKKEAVKPSSKLEIATTVEDIPENTTETVINVENIVTNFDKIADTAITEMAINITNLTPEQLTILVKEAVNHGLSDSHLLAIIMVSQHVLKTHP